ncbi:MAG: DNA polymerase III subunit gamma/tau [Spirochaetales bacterium]|nr:DNA polymerase III subunit gamma/tau [Spirochaetales bacterium]
MTYEVTATRKRPQVFDELVGQEFIITTLKNSIEQKRIAHAYLFSGPRGVGKTSAARILAKSLNCEKGPTPNPCGKCNSCREIAAGNSLDVIEIDGASNTGVNDIREIKDEVLFAPNSSRYKIYIIDEVHMLSNSAFNALLKTIEEPPPYIVFIFATTEIHKVPATIKSRCQQYRFRLISIDDIIKKLKQVADESNIKINHEALLWIAKEATGSLRDAYTIFDQVVSFSEGSVTMQNIKEKLGTVGITEMNRLTELMGKEEAGEILEYSNKIITSGISIDQFVIDLTEYFRALLFLKLGIDKEAITGYSRESIPANIVQLFSSEQLEKATEILLDLYRKLRYTVNQRFELELVLTRLSRLNHLITQEEIINRVETLKKELLPSGTGKISLSRNLSEKVKESKNITGSKPKNFAHGEQAEASGKSGETTESDFLSKVIKAVKKERLTLASALDKVLSVNIKEDRIIFLYDVKDRFSGEMVIKDREFIAEKLKNSLNKSYRIDVVFNTESAERKALNDERVKMLQRIFRGEIVKGD